LGGISPRESLSRTFTQVVADSLSPKASGSVSRQAAFLDVRAVTGDAMLVEEAPELGREGIRRLSECRAGGRQERERYDQTT